MISLRPMPRDILLSSAIKNKTLERSNMKVLTISGNSDIGKTTTIRHIFETLIDMKAVVKDYKPLGRWYDDFISTIVFNKKIIVINSLGDLVGTIKDGKKKALEINADLLINAWNENLGKDYFSIFPPDIFETTIISGKELIPINQELRQNIQKFSKDFIRKFVL